MSLVFLGDSQGTIDVSAVKWRNTDYKNIKVIFSQIRSIILN